MATTKRAMGIRREAMLAAVLVAAASLAPAAAFRHGLLPSSAPPPATSHPAQCTPSGPRVDSPSSTPFRAPAPGLLGLPHSRHLRAAQKIQVGCRHCFRGPAVARIVVATEIEISSSSCQTSEYQRWMHSLQAQHRSHLILELELLQTGSRLLLARCRRLATLHPFIIQRRPWHKLRHGTHNHLTQRFTLHRPWRKLSLRSSKSSTGATCSRPWPNGSSDPPPALPP